MIRLTATGKLFLGVSGVLYLASLTSQSSLLLLLIGILLGCYLANAMAAWGIIRMVKVESPGRAAVSEGEALDQPWRITNAGDRPANQLLIESPAGVWLRVGGIAEGETRSLVPEVRYPKRGVYGYQDFRLSSVYPFGLVRASRKLSLQGEVVVYPAIYETAPPVAGGYDVMVGGKHRGKRRSLAGTHFAGVRPVQPGDPLKRIHWKASSKGLGMMVKTFDEELSGRVAVMLDCRETGEDERGEPAIRAAGSLIFAALDAGHHVEWIDLQAAERALIPPFADGEEVLEQLARLQCGSAGWNEDGIHRVVEGISRRSALCWVLTDWDAATAGLLETFQAEGRLIHLYLPQGLEVPAEISPDKIWRYSGREILPSGQVKH